MMLVLLLIACARSTTVAGTDCQASTTHSGASCSPASPEDELALIQNGVYVLNKDQASIDPETGAWNASDLAFHDFDECLSAKLMDFLKENGANSTVEFGCGKGQYSLELMDAGMAIQCYDANNATEAVSNGLCKAKNLAERDLQKEHPVVSKADWLVSFEVGEHIPQDLEFNFLNNLATYSTKGIVMSWAIPGQGGHGHVNPQPNAYVISQIEKRGWAYDAAASSSFERAATGMTCAEQPTWFINTIMVFRPGSSLGRMKPLRPIDF